MKQSRSLRCRLIINADDLGWSMGVNEAVCALYDKGVVSSASLMVGAPSGAQASRQGRSRPRLAIGLHLAAVGAPSLLSRNEVPHLVDRKGWFPDNCEWAAFRYTLIPSCRRELRHEIRAQLDAF